MYGSHLCDHDEPVQLAVMSWWWHMPSSSNSFTNDNHNDNVADVTTLMTMPLCTPIPALSERVQKRWYTTRHHACCTFASVALTSALPHCSLPHGYIRRGYGLDWWPIRQKEAVVQLPLLDGLVTRSVFCQGCTCAILYLSSLLVTCSQWVRKLHNWSQGHQQIIFKVSWDPRDS